jgi:transposase
MNDAKYIGLDVHQATISVSVLDCDGKLVMEAILETKAETILQFMRGLRGSLQVTFEEGTCAAWLHDLLKPHVTHLVVCDPRKNNLGKVGNKNDRNDARELAELLYRNKLEPVYHGEHGIRTLKELARSYLAITRDLASRSMHSATGQLGSRRSPKPACVAALNFTISSSMPWRHCVRKLGENYSRRAGNTSR